MRNPLRRRRPTNDPNDQDGTQPAKRPSRFWRFVRRTVFLLFLIVLVGAAWLYWAVDSGWLEKKVYDFAVTQAERATGGRVEIKSFGFKFPDLTVTVSGFVLHGLEAPSDPPLLTVESAEAEVKILSFITRKVDLRAVRLTHPRVHITATRDGKTNIPVPKVRRTDRNFIDNLLAIAAKKIEISGGYVQINDRRVPLDLIAENVDVDLAYELAAPRYFGTLQARLARIGIEPLLPMAFDFSTEVAMERGVIRLNKSQLKSKDSTIVVSGLAYDLLNPSSDFGVNADIALAELGAPLRVPIEHKGRARFAGRVGLRFGKTFSYEIQGLVRGQGLGIGQKFVVIDNASLRATIDWNRERILMNRVDLSALGGAFRGSARMTDYRLIELDGVFDNLPTRSLKLTQNPLPYYALASGPVKLSTEIVSKSFRNTRVDSQVTLSPVEGDKPLRGAVNLLWDQKANMLEFRDSQVQTPHTLVEFNGTLNSRIQANASTTNLEDIQPLFSSPLPVKLEGGTATFDGFLIGSLSDPRVSGRLAMTNFVYDGRKFDRLNAQVEANQSQLTARSFELDQGRLHLSGDTQLNLDGWKMPKDAVLRTSLDMRNAPIETLLELAEVKAPVTGTAYITGDIEIRNKQISGQARLTASNVTAWNEKIDRAQAQIRFTPNRVEVVSGALLIAGAEVPVHLSWDRTSNLIDWNVQTSRLPVEGLATVKQKLPDVTGVLALESKGRGRMAGDTFTPLDINGNATLSGITWQKKPAGNLSITAATSAGEIKLQGSGDVRGGALKLEGAWKLAGDYPGGGKLDIDGLSLETLRPLISNRADPLPFQSLVKAGATYSIALLKPESWQADIVVDRFQISPNASQQLREARVQDLTVTNAEPIRVRLNQSMAEIQSARLSATNTSLEVAGTVGLQQKEGWNLRAKGALNLAQLQIFNRDLLATGTANLDATMRGSLDSPQLNGSLQLRKASLYFGDLPTGLDNAEGTIIFDRSRATIQSLNAESGGGKLSLAGFVGLTGPELVYRLQGTATQVRVRYPEGTSTQINANVNLTGTSQDSLLAGTVTILRAGFNPRTDFATMLADLTKGSGPVTVVPQNEYLRGVQFDIHVESTPNLEITTTLTRGLLAEVDLRLRGNVRRPTLLGVVSFNEGEVALFGNKYQVNRGDVRFFNPTRIEPVIDMEVETRARGITVNVNFSGTPAKLNTTYRSDPPLQPSEIIALLAVGRDPNVAAGIASSRTTTQSALQGVGSLVGEAVAASLNGRLQKFFGVSRIKIDPQLTGVDNIPQARLTLEQQVSTDITLTYITNLQRTQEQIVRIQWDFSREWSAIAVRDENGRFGIDFQYRKRFR